MTGQERGRATGQHEQRRQQATFEEKYGPWICMGCGKPHAEGMPCPTDKQPHAVLFSACCEAVNDLAPGTRVIVSTEMQPWDIEAYVSAMFTYPERIQIEYEVECDGCARLVGSARNRYIGDRRRVLCPDCEERHAEKILETRLRDAAREDSCDW